MYYNAVYGNFEYKGSYEVKGDRIYLTNVLASVTDGYDGG